MSKKSEKEAAQKEAIATLLEILQNVKARPDGTVTVWTTVRSVSRSGMSRTLDLYVMVEYDGIPEPRYITTLVARAAGFSLDKHYRLKVGGCGMDMCWHTVDSLESVLKRAGFAGKLQKRDI